jgi:hypothetical protein
MDAKPCSKALPVTPQEVKAENISGKMVTRSKRMASSYK